MIGEERIFRDASFKIQKEYKRDLRISEEAKLKLQSDYILSQYLNEVESLALYLQKSIICKDLTNQYFKSWLLNLAESQLIYDFITKMRKEDKSIYKNCIFLFKNIQKEKNLWNSENFKNKKEKY